MNTIIHLNRIRCILESAEAGGAFRRRRVRKRSSDEVAIFYTFIPDGDTERIVQKYVLIEDLDSGDNVVKNELLYQGNVNENLLVVMAGIELDGAGSNKNLAERAFENVWKEFKIASLEDLTSLYQYNERTAEDKVLTILPSLLSGGLDWFMNGPGRHDTIMMDSYLLRAIDIQGTTVPADVSRRSVVENRDIFRSVDYSRRTSGGLMDARRYDSSEAHSIYQIEHFYQQEVLI